MKFKVKIKAYAFVSEESFEKVIIKRVVTYIELLELLGSIDYPEEIKIKKIKEPKR